MLSPVFSIRDDFPPVNYDTWRQMVEASLQGADFDRALVSRTYDGIAIQPLYTRRDQLAETDPLGVPGRAPYIRGTDALGAVLSGWDLRQEYAHPDLHLARQAIHSDLTGGATSLLLRLDDAASWGRDVTQDESGDLVGRHGLTVYNTDDFATLLSDVDLRSTAVAIDAGAAFLPASALLVAAWQRQSIDPQFVRGAFQADPWGALARHGQLPYSLDTAKSQLAELAQWTIQHYPQVTSVGVDTSPYHDAGATTSQDLAFAIATGVEYLRAMHAAGLSIDDAARQMLFRIGLGTHHFLGIAKLRAGRKLWARVVTACGGSEESATMRIHARLSNRVMTQRDPYVNLLRNTVGVFAAGLGGANVITSVPFDVLAGGPNEFSRRIARNTALVLQEEAHLHRVIDPAGGSWYLDQLTAGLAESAWKQFQHIEQQGGIAAMLQSGAIAESIDATFAPRAKDIARRKAGITGVSEFPNVAEEPIARAAVDLDEVRTAALSRLARRPVAPSSSSLPSAGESPMSAAVQSAESGATIGQLARALGFRAQAEVRVTRLALRSFAAPFEELRDASDVWRLTHGQRPRVFLANMGPVAHHTARATFSKNFFEAGGFEAITNEGFVDNEPAIAAFVESQARIAVICSSDKLYPELVPALAASLKNAGARTVILAGQPGDRESEWRTAGVDRFIFLKCDAVQILRELLREEGVPVPERTEQP